jgi:hypothetical protein
MKTFAASHTQARHTIAAAASRAVSGKMILSSEREEVIKAAMFSLQITGTAYICGETITLTSQAKDCRLAAAIRNMSDAQFDRFAYGL